MASLLIPDLDDVLHARLQEAAARHHRSPEDEARELLRAGLVQREVAPVEENIVDLARRLFGPERGVDLDIPPRGSAPSRPAPDFSGPDWTHPGDGPPGVATRPGGDPA